MATKGKVVKGNAKNNVLKGAAGNDKLYGYAGNDKLYGYAGNDYLDGGKGNDVLYGGAGNDTFVYRDGDGVDTVSGYEAGKDVLHVAKGALKSVTVASNKKDLLFNVGKGRVTLKGMAGKTITLKNASGGIYTMTKTALTAKKGFAGVMDAAAHLATITTVNASAATKAATLYGNARANTITGGVGNDKLYGRAGNDVLKGGKGSDYLDGGVGNDKLYGGVGNDVFVYRDGDGVDTVYDFEAGRDTLYIAKGALKSTAVASNKKDLVFGVGKGKVTLKNTAGKTITLKNASGGAYTMTKTALTAKDGFVGTLNAVGHFSTVKTIDASNAKKGVKLYANNLKSNLTGGSGHDTLYGGAADDMISGNKGNDILHGGDGRDTMWGDAGADKLYGENGDDTLYAGDGNDYLDGGAGDDLLEANAGADYLSGGEGADTLFGHEGDDKLYGGAGADELFGDDRIDWSSCGNDYLDGGDGADGLYGGLGADTLLGGGGNDTLRGDAWYFANDKAEDGGDYLDGGAGNDKLEGCAGNDTLIGGAGDDTLEGGSGADSFVHESGNDVIWDYDKSQGDVLYFANSTIKSQAKSGYDDLLITLQDNSTVLLKSMAEKTFLYRYGRPSTQLASLVSMTQTSSLGCLANSGLPSASASGSSLIVPNGGASNALTKKS